MKINVGSTRIVLSYCLQFPGPQLNTVPVSLYVESIELGMQETKAVGYSLQCTFLGWRNSRIESFRDLQRVSFNSSMYTGKYKEKRQ